MNPFINTEYLEYILEIKNLFLVAPEGFVIPDFYFLNLRLFIDNSIIGTYCPFVLLTFGNNYIDDIFLEIVISPDKKFMKYEVI